MYELIIYLTLLGDTKIEAGFSYATGMDCTYNQGVWVQHYVEHEGATVLNLDAEDLNGDGQYDFTKVDLLYLDEDESIVSLDIVCVTTDKDMRVDLNER